MLLKKARASGQNVGKVFQPCCEAGIRELPFLKKLASGEHFGNEYAMNLNLIFGHVWIHTLNLTQKQCSVRLS